MIGSIKRRDPNIVRATVPEARVTWLGRAADGYDYATHAGQEYMVEPHPSKPEDHARRTGELYIMRVWTEVVDGSAFEHHATHRAQRVADGTFAAAAAKAAERDATRTRKAPPRPLDALAAHPLLARRPDGILPIPGPGGWAEPALLNAPEGASADLLVAVRSRTPGAIRIPGREPRQGVPAILAILQQQGVELALTPTGTMYAKGGRLLNSVRDLIERAAPLLHAHLHGTPLRCEFEHPDGQAPEAVTVLLGGAACCAQHLEPGE